MNDRKKFEEWLKEDTTIELNDELTDFAWYVWKAATAESAARIAELEQKLHSLILAANTVNGCYTRNPANFAAALANMEAKANECQQAITNTGDKT